MSSPLFDELSPSRAQAVIALSLDDARLLLRGLALRSEIRFSNQILRVLHEFEKQCPDDEPIEIPTFVDLVEPRGPNHYFRHLVDPRRSTSVTFCGVNCGSWRSIGTFPQRDGTVRGDGLCRRCLHSLGLAVAPSLREESPSP